MCARSASAGWLHLVEQVQEGTEKLKNIKLKKHISLKKKVSGVLCSGVLGEMVTPNHVRTKKEMCGGGKKGLGRIYRGSTHRDPQSRELTLFVLPVTRNKQFFSSLFLQQDWCVLSSSPLLVSCGCVLPGVLLPPGVSQ